MSKKIGILTLPLICNYGAILQAYALQKSIQRLGAECWVIDKELPIYPYHRRLFSIISRFAGKYLRGEQGYKIIPYWMSKKTEHIISQYTRTFVEKYIVPRTNPIMNLSTKDDIFDNYIVGSDQVWRKSTTLSIHDYLFGFVAPDKKKSAYAASFGVDYWEFSQKKTQLIRKLIKDFDTITVREDSAVEMLKKNVGIIDSTQVLDPTMLLDKEDYISLIEDMPKLNEEQFIFSYVLDEDEEKESLSNKISHMVSLPVYSIMPSQKLYYGVNLDECIFPAVEEWIRGFRDCQYVITDSFHGTVFAIIFNKPFFVLRNNKRGNTRLDSLLKLFKLQDRILSSDRITSIINNIIIWKNVNDIREIHKQKSNILLSKMIK